MITLERFQEIRSSKHLIIVDANILLELYRKPSVISFDIINAFEQIKENIYVPRQVYDEYLRHYHEVRGREEKKYKKINNELTQFSRTFQGHIASRITECRKHNYTDVLKLQKDLNEKIEEINSIIKEFENSHREEIR